MRSWLRPTSGRARCRRCRWARSVAASTLASTLGRSRWCRPPATAWPASTNGLASSDASAQPYRLTRRLARALDAPVEPPERASARSGRPAAAASRPPACCRSGPCASSRVRGRARGRRLPAAGGHRARAMRAIAAGLSRPRCRRPSRTSSAGRSSRRRPASGPAPARPHPKVASIRTRASPASRGRSTPTMTPVEVSLWAHASASAAGLATGSGESPGSASTMIGSSRKGGARHLPELGRELAVGEVRGALTDQARRRRPERRRAPFPIVTS